MLPLRLLARLGLVLAVSTLVGCSTRPASSLDDLVRVKKGEFVEISDGQPRVVFGDVFKGEQVRRDVTLDVSGLRDGTHLTVKPLIGDSRLRIENGCETVPEKECVIGIELLNDGSGMRGDQSTTLYIEDDDGRTTDLDVVYRLAESSLRVKGDGFDPASGTLDVGTVYTPTTVVRTLTIENVSPRATAPLSVGIVRNYGPPAVLESDATTADDGGLRIDKSSCGPGPLAAGATCTLELALDARLQFDFKPVVGFATFGRVFETIRTNGIMKRAAKLEVLGQSVLELRTSSSPGTPSSGTLRVPNRGDQTLRGITFSLQGEDASSLTLDDHGCTEIAPESNCVVDVKGPATMPAAGLFATLTATAGGTRAFLMPVVGGEIMSLSVTPQRRAGTGGGTVTATPPFLHCDGECVAVLRKSQASISLTATPAKGYRFQRWSTEACPGTGPCVLRFEAGSQSVSAFFEAE